MPVADKRTARREAEPTPAASKTAQEGPGVLRVALAQMAPALGLRQANLQKHLTLVAAAQEQRADLTIFPELSLTGYFLRDMVPDVALSRSAPELAEIARAAGAGAVVAGFVEESRQHRFYNAAFYAQGGEIRHVHRKVYLPTYGLFDESRYFAGGTRLRAFDTPRFGRIGLLICEDFWHLSAAAVMQAEEIDVLICIANSPARGIGTAQTDSTQSETAEIETAATYKVLARAYAQLLGCVVIVVNRVGYEDGLCFWGGSMVVGADGRVLGEAPLLEEALCVVPIAQAELRRQRLVTPLGRDEQLLLTLEELRRIVRRRFRE